MRWKIAGAVFAALVAAAGFTYHTATMNERRLITTEIRASLGPGHSFVELGRAVQHASETIVAKRPPLPKPYLWIAREDDGWCELVPYDTASLQQHKDPRKIIIVDADVVNRLRREMNGGCPTSVDIPSTVRAQLR